VKNILSLSYVSSLAYTEVHGSTERLSFYFQLFTFILISSNTISAAACWNFLSIDFNKNTYCNIGIVLYLPEPVEFFPGCHSTF
jgi:hypothetical protein